MSNMNYKVFTDFHHASLLQSLILLFEKRLGGEVYRPIGMEWAEQGYWKIFDHPATQAQYLGINAATPDKTPPLNDVIGTGKYSGIPFYFCHDIDSGQMNRAITFDAFLQLDIDIIIASIPAHIEPFKKLCELHPNKPKLIYQIGNAWTIEAGLTRNIMASAKIKDVPEGINFIEYHQEFDTDIFKPADYQPSQMNPTNAISSFVNVFNGESHFAQDWKLFLEIEKLMPDWDFKSYGGQCRDGAVGPANILADRMREARFIWHTKAGGDGYGHIIHNVPAVGRPLIVKKLYYANKMAEPLLIDGETCVTIDGLRPAEIVDKINYYNDPARYLKLCRTAYENFTKICNFNQEFQDLQNFLGKLL